MTTGPWSDLEVALVGPGFLGKWSDLKHVGLYVPPVVPTYLLTADGWVPVETIPL